MNLAYPHADQFEPLAESAQIRGVKGIYQITRFYKQRGIGRIYEAEQFPDGQPVTLREYLLPAAFFNSVEAQQRKQMFNGLAGVSLADGRVQDIRLVLPWEAIADPNQNRCYLITKGTLDTYPSLKEYQSTHGSLGEASVRECLSQTLQTLEFLHNQKFHLPNGQMQEGILHGNLSLDSLLLYRQEGESTIPTDGDEAARFVSYIETGAFTIYLCDLSLWEQVFAPTIAQVVTPTAADDLQALGKIAFSLLTGDRPHPETDEPLNPRHDEDWPSVSPAFKHYLMQLMGIYSPYKTAELARRELLRLPPAPPPPVPVPPPPPKDDKTSRVTIPWRLMLLLMLLACLAQLLAWLITSLRVRSLGQPPQLLCCMAEVAGVPSGIFTYTSEADGTWSYIRQEHLIEQNKTLDRVIEERLAAQVEESGDVSIVFDDSPNTQGAHHSTAESVPPIELVYQPRSSFDQVLRAVRRRQADFFMAGLTQPTAIDLATEPIAYDGLAAIVAFSYARRHNSLPQALEGQISVRQLRRLYTGQITNWHQLGGADLPVQLYLPNNTETLRIVEDRVLGDRQSIEQFQQLLQEGHITLLPTFEMLQHMLRDFEDNGIGAIAFAPISQVFGQCSVYPLAVRQNNAHGVSPLVDSEGNAIRPSTDLCNAKGSYTQDPLVFRDQTYPLAYSISVVYRRDNRLLPIGTKFAEILKSDESQRLLQQAGLVPLQPLSTVPPSHTDQSFFSPDTRTPDTPSP